MLRKPSGDWRDRHRDKQSRIYVQESPTQSRGTWLGQQRTHDTRRFFHSVAALEDGMRGRRVRVEIRGHSAFSIIRSESKLPPIKTKKPPMKEKRSRLTLY